MNCLYGKVSEYHAFKRDCESAKEADDNLRLQNFKQFGPSCTNTRLNDKQFRSR